LDLPEDRKKENSDLIGELLETAEKYESTEIYDWLRETFPPDDVPEHFRKERK
jgi:hypothetical protein